MSMPVEVKSQSQVLFLMHHLHCLFVYLFLIFETGFQTGFELCKQAGWPVNPRVLMCLLP